MENLSDEDEDRFQTYIQACGANGNNFRITADITVDIKLTDR